jgi:hypothetical protein
MPSGCGVHLFMALDLAPLRMTPAVSVYPIVHNTCHVACFVKSCFELPTSLVGDSLQ